jgi:hypothetical protein
MVRRREAVQSHPPFKVYTQHNLQFALGFGLVAIGYQPLAISSYHQEVAQNALQRGRKEREPRGVPGVVR